MADVETKAPEIVREKPKDFCMVWTKNGRVPRYRHNGEDKAFAEAERLARQHPGRKFLILQAIGKVHVPRPDSDNSDGEPTERPAGEFLNPGAGLLCKLASITVHADEYLSSDGHQFDVDALTGLLADPEVKDWIAQMTAAALAPQKRT